MTAAPAAAAMHSLVLARIGSLCLAVPAAWVAGAHASRDPLAVVPRRQGAIAGLLPTPQGTVPVVDLGRWVPLPPGRPAADASAEAVTAALPCYLILRQERQRLALRVDELLGLRRVPSARLQRLHHRDDPEELFDAVLSLDDAPESTSACVLEPRRLMDLLALWSDDTAAHEPPHQGAATGATDTAPAARLAVVRSAGRRLAVDLRDVAELLPMPDLTTRLPPGAPSTGFTRWRGAALPVLSAAWLHATDDTPAGPLALVLCDESGRAVALPVDALLGTLAAPARLVSPQGTAAAWWRGGWADDEGQVDVLDVPALLEALPESALARHHRQATSAQVRCNDRPYFVIQAGRTVALPIDDVLAIVDTATLPPEQDTLAWRGRQLPLRGPAGANHLAAVLVAADEPVALRIVRLVGLVPAGTGECGPLPGAPGAFMLHVPALHASFAATRAADLLGC